MSERVHKLVADLMPWAGLVLGFWIWTKLPYPLPGLLIVGGLGFWIGYGRGLNEGHGRGLAEAHADREVADAEREIRALGDALLKGATMSETTTGRGRPSADR